MLISADYSEQSGFEDPKGQVDDISSKAKKIAQIQGVHEWCEQLLFCSEFGKFNSVSE